MGFEIESPDMEFLDKEGNVQTGRELYTLCTYKEEGDVTMSLNFYMVSDEYARDSFSEIHEKNGIWYSTILGEGDPTDNWYMLRTYDPKTGLMMDASGTYLFDWEAAGLFE
ncbi:MAG: hypothetical protein K6G10_12385 [Butyrivibrio sp.]|nr:hypothetical protein [Butyrivibrio sp.]